jgi:hypothetical protein
MPADLGASAAGMDAVPASLNVNALAPVELRSVQVKDLSFLREQVDAQQRQSAFSELQTGSLTLTDTGEQVTLGEGAMLRLRGSSGTLTSLRIEAERIRVRFEGTADRITIGTGDFARDLRPTVLDYLFHQQKVGFLWGAATFLWGVLWSARALIATK